MLLGKVSPSDDNSNALTVYGYVGLDPHNFKDTWIRGTIYNISLDQFCTAFELTCSNPPQIVQDMLFPEGLTLTYSAQGKQTHI